MATPNSTNAPPDGCCPATAGISNISPPPEFIFNNDSRRDILELGYPGFFYSIHHMKMAAEAIYWNLFEITPVDTWENFFLVTKLHDTQLINESQRNINTLDDVLSNFSASPKHNHLSIMTSVDGKSWIAVFLSKVVGNLRVLFFDPCGNQLCEELRLKIEDQMKDYQVEIASHAQDPNIHMSHIGACDTGPICLRYVEMILLKMGQDTDVSAIMRSKLLFQVLAELNMLPHQYEEEILEIRERFQQQCYLQHATSSLSMLVHTQSKFQDFQEDFSNFLKKQIAPLDAKKDFIYLECLQMLESSEAQNDSRIQDKTLINKIEAAREAVEESFFLRHMKEKGAMLAEKLTEDVELCVCKDEGFKKLSAKYEQNFLSGIFGIFQVCCCYKSTISHRVKEKVCSILGLNHSQLNQMLQTEKNPLLTNIVPGSLSTAKDISSLLESYNKLRPNDDQNEIITESEVTRESLNKFREAFLEENGELVVDPQSVDQVVTVHKYIYSSSNKWRKASATEIYNWAGQIKNKTLKADILEIIASLDRANEITTNGQRLELYQILSLIIHGSSESSTGKISQIHVNEESKTKIIAMLAIVKILKGEPAVDIVTRSSGLADKAFRDNFNFYKMFQIHSAMNKLDINEETVQGNCGLQKCYLADVVYGTIETFQTDYLQDIWGTRRGNRGFGALILDNVDCMLLEDSVRIPTLVSTFPGMESLRYVYAKIWTSLPSLEDSYPKQLRKILLDKALELNEAQDTIFLAERIRRYKDTRLQKQSEIYKNIHTEIKKGLKYSLKVPNHLIDFVESSLENWVNSAILVMYKFRENEDYYLKPGKGKEPSVVPIYGKDIGNTFERDVWTHDMYSFVQLKHNLKLTHDEFMTGRISAYGYISLYGENILGLTCTLGSRAEQELLRKMYNVDLSCIPGPKSRQFLEIKGRVISDINWAKTVAMDSSLKFAIERRPVVIICKSIEECQNVADCLRIKEAITQQTEEIAAGESGTYRFRPVHKIIETDVTVHPTITLHPADIIVTTDNAVRSVSFCLSEDLKSTQGRQLHICIGFCPKTEREKQSLFRIAGFTNGTAQMIVRLSEIQALKICPEAEQATNVEEDTSSESSSSVDISAFIEYMNSYNPEEEYDPNNKIYFDQTDDTLTDSCLPENDVSQSEESIRSVIEDEKLTLHEQVLQIRDFWNLEPYKKHLCDFEVINAAISENELQLWKNLSDAVLPKLYLEDQIFHHYWNHHQRLHYQNISNVTFQFLLKDMQEFWSIWLSNIDFTESVKLAKRDSHGSRSGNEDSQWDILKSLLYKKSQVLFTEYQILVGNKGMVFGPCTGDFQTVHQSSENIYRNPYYGIQEADFHSRRGNTGNAFECIDNVIRMARDSNEMILFAAHMKKFCSSVLWQKGSYSEGKNGVAMALIKCKFENLDLVQMEDAKQALIEAQKCVNLQMKNFQDFIDQHNQNLPLLKENLSKTTLFVQLETPDLNISEFLNSEVLSLQLNLSLINELLKCIDSTAKEITPEINPSSFSTLTRPGSEKLIQILIQNESKLELELFGLSLLQYLKASQGIQKPHNDSYKIAEGLVALSSTSFIPLASAFSTSVGSALIFKGFNDIVLSMLGESSEHEATEMINLINAGVLQLVSEDLEINVQTMEILHAAARSCHLVTSKLISSPKYQLLDGPALVVFRLEKLTNFFSRVLHMMKFRTNEERSYFLMNNESKAIQTLFSLASSLEKATGSQKVIEERIMERHESVYVKQIFEDAYDFAIAVVKRNIEECQGQIKYVDETKFLKSLVVDLEKTFENTWRTMTERISSEIKEKYRNIHDPSNNFFGGFQEILFGAVVKMTSKLEYILMTYVNCEPDGELGLASFDELFKWRVQFVIKNINNHLLTVDTTGKPFSKADTEEDSINFATVTSAETEKDDDGYHELLVDEIKRKLVKKFQFTFTQADQLQNIQTAYMILTAEQVLESECLEELKNGNSLSMEELQIILKRSFCAVKLKNEVDLSKTTEENKNTAIQILEERLQKNIRWHQNIQRKYSKSLGGVPSFDVSVVQSQAEQEHLSRSGSEGDIGSDTGTFENENCNHETHGALGIAKSVKSAQTLSRHSSPKRGLEFLSKEKISIGETLSTFLDMSSQLRAMNACLRQLESELVQLFQSPGGCSRCEVHVDITQLLDVTFDMCEITLSMDDRGNAVENSRFSKASCITLILGHRPPQKFYNTKRLFYVESVFPRIEVPGGLRGDAPYNIIICN